MEASTSETSDDRPAAGRGGRRSGMARWLPGATGRGDGRADALVEELEAELALLREENARLRIRQQPGRRSGWSVDVRELAEGRAVPDGRADEASELLTESRILRRTLLDACRDVERAMQEIRRRLEELEPPDATATAADGSPASAER